MRRGGHNDRCGLRIGRHRGLGHCGGWLRSGCAGQLLLVEAGGLGVRCVLGESGWRNGKRGDSKGNQGLFHGLGP